MSGAADVRALLAAAARVARDPAIVDALVSSTGLSRENVELSLAAHLELDAPDAEIDSLVAGAGRAESVHVVLSASVFVAPLRAIALALAASDRVTVHASRREPVFARALVAALGDPRVRLVEERVVDAAEIHVYGRAETIASVRRAAGPRSIVRGHGPGLGVALVSGDFARAASLLAEDVTAFDQRGCLSPRVAYVVGDAHAFARAAADALEARAALFPRGALDPGEATDLARWTSTAAYAGTLHRGAASAVAVLDADALPPSGRHLLVRPLDSPASFLSVLGALGPFVTTVGTNLALDPVPHVRLCALGAMQRPPFDGPVDRRPPT